MEQEKVAVDKLVSAYIKIRDHRDEIKREAEEKMKELEAEMAVISQTLLDHFKAPDIALRPEPPMVQRTEQLSPAIGLMTGSLCTTSSSDNDAYELARASAIHQSNMKQFLGGQPQLAAHAV